MKNIYNNLLEKGNGQVSSSCQSFTQLDGKKKYTITTESTGEAVYTSEVSIAKLEGDTTDFDLYYNNVDDFLADDIMSDCIYSDFNSLIKFGDNGRIKIDGFVEVEEFQTDKIISVKETNGKTSITGIIVDLKKDEDFTDAYYNGIKCDMPNCKKAAEKYAKDHKRDAFIEALDEDEVTNFLNTLRSKVQSAAELYPQGLYVIIDSRIYYLSPQDYWKICASTINENHMFKLVVITGLPQLHAKLLDNKKQVLYTISQIIKSDYAKRYILNKKYLDLNNETSLGTSKETFLTNLLSDDRATYEFLESELKPTENVK